jgi:hypothetical protein
MFLLPHPHEILEPHDFCHYYDANAIIDVCHTFWACALTSAARECRKVGVASDEHAEVGARG